MNYETYNSLSKLIDNNISLIRSHNFDLIVGIPRSGMIPAYMVALRLNLNCCSTNELLNNAELKVGRTRRVKTELRYAHEAKRILLVDDSIASGKSLKNEIIKMPNEIYKKITTMAVYSTDKTRDDVDFFLKYLPSPRVFEWNLYHHSIISRSGFDMDGVLCRDPLEEQNDDGVVYIEFMLNADPLYIPTVKINTIITSRLEKYRKETETWLRRNDVKYDRLVMLDLPNKEERQRLNIHGVFKAEKYKELDLDLYFESSYKQAVEINRLTKMPVYCVETNEMITYGNLAKFVYGSKKAKMKIVIALLPKPIYQWLRRIYRKLKKDNKSYEN